MKYTKPPLSIDQQLDLLASRGMIIPDRAWAFRYLSHISYYRLRGYWIPFEKPDRAPNHAFQEGTTFDDVLDLYIFDRKFRLLIIEAIERVEVSLRAHFANELGLEHGSHFYLKKTFLRNAEVHGNLIDSLKTEIERSREVFIEHYRATYDQPPLPPIWAVSEVMSFGQLSIWFKYLKSRRDRNRIARAYGIDERLLQSFMHHLTFIRNIAAHHGRLWNRRLTITMTIPKKPPELAAMFNHEEEAKRYIGNTIILLAHLSKLISPGTSWPARICKLIEDAPPARPAAMGLRDTWRELSLWNGT